MISDVKVVINIDKPTGKIGFGYPLIFEGLATVAVPYTECSGIDEVKALFPETTGVYKAALLLFMQNNPPSKIAVCASVDNATTALARIWQNEFRQIIVTSFAAEGEDDLKTVSDYVEAKGDKLLFATITDVETIKTLASPDRTIVFKYPESTQNAVAAVVGAIAGKKAGSVTYKNLILKGINPLVLSDSEIIEATEKNVITFVKKSGDNVTTEGKVLSGEYVDIIDSRDYIIQQIEYQTQRTLNMADKIPYDNNGIAMLESICINVLKDAFNNGIIAVNTDGLPDYSVNYATRDLTDPNDRVARKYIEGNFSFAIAGAIHTLEIKGTIII